MKKRTSHEIVALPIQLDLIVRRKPVYYAVESGDGYEMRQLRYRESPSFVPPGDLIATCKDLRALVGVYNQAPVGGLDLPDYPGSEDEAFILIVDNKPSGYFEFSNRGYDLACATAMLEFGMRDTEGLRSQFTYPLGFPCGRSSADGEYTWVRIDVKE